MNSVTESIKKRFGKIFSSRRQKFKISMYAIEKETGLINPQIKKIEKGKTNYTIDSFLKFCAATKVTPILFLDEDAISLKRIYRKLPKATDKEREKLILELQQIIKI